MFVNFNILNQLGSPAINSNTFANRPAAGQTGRLFVSTDTFEIYRDNGTTWDLIGGPGSSTITGSGTATQVAYFTSSQAIGSSANLFWDNTQGFLGVATATPSARIEAVKTDGVGIYANYTTNAGSGSSATAIWAKNVTNSSGFAAVIEETTPNTTAGQYPLLIKHSLSSGTAGVGMGTGVHWQLPDDAGTFKTTQLTIETINAAAATYATRYRFNVQSNGSSTPVAYINATGLGIFTATPGAALDIHSTGVIAQFNTTSGTGNTYISWQRTGTGVWRLGDTYNGGNNFFELHNTVLAIDALEFEAATNKSSFQATQTYSTGLARGNYFDYNLSVSAGGSFSSPNSITALGASLDLTLAGNATIPSGARSGLDAYNSIAFTGTGTLTHTQGTQIRAYSNVTAGWAFNGSATGTITHLAGLRVLFPDNTGSAVTVTNNYGLLINNQTANTGTVTYTNRWGIYQEGSSDLNYMAANLLLGSTTNTGNRLQVTGTSYFSGNVGLNQTTPVTQLEIYYPFSGSTATTFGLVANSSIHIGAPGFANQYNQITFGYDRTNAAAVIATVNNSSSGSTNQDILFGTRSGTSGLPSERIRITSDGLLQSTTGSFRGIDNIDITASNTNTNSTTFSLNSRGTLGIMTFLTNNTERMRLDASGNLGLGTSSPNVSVFSRALTISSANSGIELTSATNVVQGALGSNTNGLLIEGIGSIGLRFFTSASGASSERARITAGGNLLVGTTTDTGQKLQVSGKILISDNNGVISTGNAGTSPIWYQLTNSGGTTYIGRESSTGSAFGASAYSTVLYSTGNYPIEIYTNAVKALTLTSTQNAEFTGSIKTAAPTTGTAANWKLGSRVAATVALDTTQYIELDVGGTLYKLAIVT